MERNIVERKALLKNEIYIQDLTNNGKTIYLFKHKNKKALNAKIKGFFRNWEDNSLKGTFYEATDKEKHWLNECIRLNEYISFEKAMKTYTEQSNLTLVL